MSGSSVWWRLQKRGRLRLLLIRMFNTTFVGVDVLGDPQYTNFGRELVFSADLCYNGSNQKAFLREEGGTRSVTEGACVTLSLD